MKKNASKRPRAAKKHTRSTRRKHRTYTQKVRSVGPLAPRCITRMRYFASFTSGSNLDSLFNLNSLHDPDESGIGHQPYGYDTYSSLYAKYKVFACSWRIRASTDSPTAVNVTVVPNNSIVPFGPGSSTLVAESPRSQTVLVGYGNPRVITGKLFLPSLTGVSATTYKGDQRYGAQIGYNPSERMGLHICTSNMDGTSSTRVQYQVELVYHTEWYDPFELAQS